MATLLASGVLGIGSSTRADDRGYDPSVLEHGQALYLDHCASCHGDRAQGTVKEWHKRDDQGNLPPPPLNGTAHTWHHTVAGLTRTIQDGTLGIGGNMPAWGDSLSDDDIFSIIIWLTSLWPDPIFEAWLERHQQ